MRVGIVALQGDFEKHAGTLQRLEADWLFVRRLSELDQADALILPGGESSTMLRLLERFKLDQPLDEFVRCGRPVLATCAGLIR